MDILQIHLLGDFQLSFGDRAVSAINMPRLQSLLAYLLLHRQAPQSRQRLAFLFWPDSTETQARANLRQMLHLVRHTLPDADRFLQIDAQTVQWLPNAPFLLDVAEFECHLAQASTAEQGSDSVAAQAALEAAVAYFPGDLLPGCYDDWVQPERERLRERFIDALSQLVWLLEQQRAYAAAIRHANRLLRHEPLHEETYRRLMRLHALNGDRAAALRVYQTCATVLKRELDVAPGEQMQEAYRSLLNHAMPAGPSQSPETHPAALPPLIGRQEEWQQLLAAWQAAARQPHFLVIAGEAGIGKTRLAEELYYWVSRQGMTVAQTRAYAAEGALAYAPVTEWLRTAPLRARWQRLDAVWLSELARLLPELLVEQPHLPHPQPLTDSWQRKRLFEALIRAIQTITSPLLLVLDDLQWCDQETFGWLHYLLRAGLRSHLLIVGTVRPEEVGNEHPLTTLLLELRSSGQVTELELGPLTLEETAALAAQVVGQPLAHDAGQRLYQATEGNPLFVLETAQAVLSGGVGEWGMGGELPLSPKVQAVIRRRLAQLAPPAQELISLAAVIGRSFTLDLLAQASNLDEDALVRILDELWQRRLVREQGADAYDFSHDRIREVAQAAISRAQRRLLHRRAAQALENVYTANLDSVSGQLAVHYEASGLLEQAILYHRRAGEAAHRLYALEDVIKYWTRALELLKLLPASQEGIRQQIDLLLLLGPIWLITTGYRGPEMAEIYRQAQALSIEIGDAYRLFAALRGLKLFYGAQGQVSAARALSEQCLALARQQEDPALLVAAFSALAGDLLAQGELPPAKAYYEEALRHYDPQQHEYLVSLFSAEDPALSIFGPFGLCLWLMGYIDQARRCTDELLARSPQMADLFNRSFGIAWAGIHCALRGDWPTALARAEETIAIHTQWKIEGDPFPDGLSRLSGWALAEQGQLAEGIARMERSIKASGVDFHTPKFLAPLAAAYGRVGQVGDGLAVVQDALSIADRTGMAYWNAELHRLRGELLLAQGTDEQAVEACYLQAIDIAHQQSAKSFELRAAMSLVRLWQRQGKRSEAYQLLTAIYSWFTEGFDTLDLQQAKALLAELA